LTKPEKKQTERRNLPKRPQEPYHQDSRSE
jgi:hypothetical protein